MNNKRLTTAYRVALFVALISTLLSTVYFLLPTTASAFSAGFNPEINYQGRLIGLNNVAVSDSTYNIRFNLYTTPTGGVPIWTETHIGSDRIQVTSGLFSVMLGSTTPLTNIDFNQTLYLGVEIGGPSTTTPEWDGEMVPRKILGAVPAAFVANNVIGDVASTTYATSTYATSTNFFSTNSTIANLLGTSGTTTNATSTNLFSNIGTFTNLYVNNYEQNNGTFNITSTVPTGDIFSVFDNAITNGNLIHQALTANAGNGQVSKGQVIDLTDNTSAGGGYSALTVNTSGAGSGTGAKNLLDLNPSATTEAVFDNTGSFHPTTAASTNTNSIGTPSFYWKNGYFDTITANNLAGTVISGATSATTWTIGSTQTGDVNEAIVFQRNSGSGNALLSWNASNGTLNDQRYLSANYPFNVNYTVNNSSIGTNVNLYSGILTNNTSVGTQKLFSLTNTGTGTTANGIYLNNTGTAITALQVDGTWTNGLIVGPNAGNVGIGTTTPIAKLDIFNTTSSATAPLFSVASSTAGAGTSTSLFINSVGNVGIGTANPATKFDVLGSGTPNTTIDSVGSIANFTGPTQTGQGSMLSIDSNDSEAADTGGVLGFGGRYVTGDTGYTNWASIKGLKTSSGNANYSGYLSFFTRQSGFASSERMRIDNLGNVGIGTTAPANKLDISGGNYSSTVFDSGIRFAPYGATQNGNRNFLFDQSGNNKLSIQGYVTNTAAADSSSVIALQPSGGNVGIGTTNPGTKLEVNGGLLVDGSTTLQSFTATNGTTTNATGTNLFLSGIASSTDLRANTAELGNVTATNLLATTLSLTNLLVNGSSTLQNFSAQYGSTTEIQSSSNAYFATSGGSVGIGTTNPAGKLEVYDSVGSTVLKLDNLYGESNSNAYGYTRLTALTGGDGLLLSQNVNTTDSSPVVNSPLDSSGQAGEAISMGQNYGGTAFLNYAAGGGTVTPSVAMFVKDNGNVGIGTTGPAGKLEVSNTGDSYSYITTTGTNNAAISWLRTGDGTTSGRYAYTLYQSLETSPQRWNVGLFATKNYTIADSTFGSSPVTIEPNAGNNLLYLKSGNVGIGTTNPGSPLQVQAPATDAVPVAELTNPDTTNGYGLLVAGGGSASTRYAFNVADPTGSTNYLTVKTQTGEVGNVGIGQFNPASPLSVNGGISAGTYSTTAAPSNGMIISGNVGIGTTNPSVTGSGLEVKGVTNDATIKVTGNTGGNAYLQLNAASGGNAYVNSVGSGYIALGANGAASNAMTILSSGNVGIGTTNPDQALTVKGTIDYANTAMVTATVVDDSGGAIGGTCPTFTTGPQQFYIQTSATVLGSYIVYDSTHSGHAQINPPVTISCLSSGSVPYVKVILFQAISGLAVGDTITVYNPAGDLGSATGFVNNINAIVINAAKTTVNGFDLAEQYQTSDASIGPGDVISVDPTQKEFITKTTTSYDPGILGVVSTDPGLVLGNASSDLWRQVALKGRVPVNVTDENGVVKAGDFLTSSASLPGYAMKAASSGEVLGKALEDFDPTSEKTQIVNGLAIHTGSVSLFMNVGWQDISSIVMANASSTSPLLGLQDAIDSATSTLASVVSALGLNLADASAGLDIGSNVTIRGALHVDQIGSIGDILNLESDVNFIGRPYFNSDTGGLAIIQQGALQVDVSFDKPYVNAPVVNASLSLDASSSDAQVQEILGASVGYAVTHRSQNGFSIMLSKPAPEPMTFSWIALAIQNMKISDSGTVGQDLSQPSPNLGEGGGGVGDQNSGGSDASSTPPIDNGTSTPPVDNGTTTSPTDNGTSTPPTTEVGDASSTPPTIDNTGSTTPPVVDSGTGDNGSTTQPTN